MRLALLAALVAAVALSSASAGHCASYSTSTPTGRTACDTDGSCIYWVWDDCHAQGCFFSFWVYEETNGYEGLQRDDPIVDDTCHGMIEADRVLF